MSSRVISEFGKQAEHCVRNSAPRVGSIVNSIAVFINNNGGKDFKFVNRVIDWPANLLEDAVGLRLCAALQRLHFEQNESSKRSAILKDLFHLPFKSLEQVDIDRMVTDILTDGDIQESLLKSLDKPPQTNEVGRSALYVGALSFISKLGVNKFDLFEIGTSGGLNLNLSRYQYKFAVGTGQGSTSSIEWGDPSSDVIIMPEMRGPGKIPSNMDFKVLSAKGCDLFPFDLRMEEEALRMKSFIWADHAWRHQLLDRAIETLRMHPPQIEKADAATWVREQFSQAREGKNTTNTCKVLVHSIVWQYLPEKTKNDITAVMDEAASRATPENPVAWVAVETNRETMNHELSVRYYSGNENARDIRVPLVLAEAQSHGRWIRWTHEEDI